MPESRQRDCVNKRANVKHATTDRPSNVRSITIIDLAKSSRNPAEKFFVGHVPHSRGLPGKPAPVLSRSAERALSRAPVIGRVPGRGSRPPAGSERG